MRGQVYQHRTDLLATTGGSVDRVEYLLRLQRHLAPALLGCFSSQGRVECLKHVDFLRWGMARVVFGHRASLHASMHVEIAFIGVELGLHDIVTHVGSKDRQNEIVHPNTPFFAADVNPLLVLRYKGAVETG